MNVTIEDSEIIADTERWCISQTMKWSGGAPTIEIADYFIQRCERSGVVTRERCDELLDWLELHDSTDKRVRPYADPHIGCLICNRLAGYSPAK